MLAVNSEKVRKFLADVANKYKHANVKIYLFGSFLTNNFKPDSDVDVLIIAPKQLQASLKNDLDKILLSDGILISSIILTPAKFNEVKDLYFYKKVVQEGKKLG